MCCAVLCIAPDACAESRSCQWPVAWGVGVAWHGYRYRALHLRAHPFACSHPPFEPFCRGALYASKPARADTTISGPQMVFRFMVSQNPPPPGNACGCQGAGRRVAPWCNNCCPLPARRALPVPLVLHRAHRIAMAQSASLAGRRKPRWALAARARACVPATPFWVQSELTPPTQS